MHLFGYQMSLVQLIMIITVLVSLATFGNARLMAALMMNPWTILREKQYYRFITSGFIHKDFQHLFLNMFSFYFFGMVIERDFHATFGGLAAVYFAALYLLAIVVSDIPTFLKEKNNPAYNSLGASGGVSAVIFAFILRHPLDKIYLYFFVPLPGFVLGILYIAYSYYSGKKSHDAINHDAHLYGALFGVLFVIVLDPSSVSHFVEQLRTWSIFR